MGEALETKSAQTRAVGVSDGLWLQVYVEVQPVVRCKQLVANRLGTGVFHCVHGRFDGHVPARISKGQQ